MRPHDWYLHTLLRLDNLQAIVNALNAFRASKTDAEARKCLKTAARLARF